MKSFSLKRTSIVNFEVFCYGIVIWIIVVVNVVFVIKIYIGAVDTFEIVADVVNFVEIIIAVFAATVFSFRF